MAEAETKKQTLQDLLRVVFRRWRVFLIAAVLFATAAMLGGQFVPLRYTGETKFERRSDVAAEENARGKGKSDSFDSQKLTLEHDLIGYEAVALAAEDEQLTLGFPRGPDGQLTREGIVAKQELINKLVKALKVTWDARSEGVDLITVSFTHSDPNLAERMPNKLVSNYIDATTQKTVDLLKERREFLGKQVKECSTRLDDVNGKIVDFKAKHANAMPDKPDGLQQQILELTNNINVMRVQHTTATEKLARLKALVQAGKVAGTDLKALQDQLQRYRDELSAALTIEKLGEGHYRVKRLREMIAQLEGKTKGETASTVPAVAAAPAGPMAATAAADDNSGGAPEPTNASLLVASTEAEVSVTDRELVRLQAHLTQCTDALTNFGPVRQEYLQLIDTQRQAEEEKARWQQQESAVRSALVAEIDNHRTHLKAVEAAQMQSKPSFPTLPMVLGASLMGGLAFGAGVVFLAQVLDRSVSTLEEAAHHFGLPVHGVVEEIITSDERSRKRRRKWILVPMVTVVLTGALVLSIVNIWYWLAIPERYKEWSPSPIGSFIVPATNPESASRVNQPATNPESASRVNQPATDPQSASRVN